MPFRFFIVSKRLKQQIFKNNFLPLRGEEINTLGG